jgi:hypothetical protein
MHWPLAGMFNHPRGLPADTLLRLTIEFADGRSVSNANPRAAGPGEPDPDRPMLNDAPGTSWGADEWYPHAWCLAMQYCVRPLPHRGRWPSPAPGRPGDPCLAARGGQRGDPLGGRRRRDVVARRP